MKTYLPLLLGMCFLTGCPSTTVPVTTPTVDAPSERPYFYYFEHEGQPNVINDGQVCRNLLFQDLGTLIHNLSEENAVPVSYERLYSYYDNNGMTIDGPTLTMADLPLLFPTIRGISAIRDMKKKFHGAWVEEAQEDIENWCAILVDNFDDVDKKGSYRVYIDPETGYDISEMYPLTLLGGAMWSHGLNNYFRYVENDNNDTIVYYPGVDWLNYTWMEHHLDEAFGYYGAARNFLDFTNQEVSGYEEGLNYKDDYLKDGKLDFKTEYNFIFARLAAERDLASHTNTDFSRSIFDAFYEARLAITRKDYDKLLEKKAIILDNWEKVVAATAIHYLNATMKELDYLDSTPGYDPELFYKNWSAMFKYTEMLRYNYANRLTQYQDILDERYRTEEVPFPKAIINHPEDIPDYKNSLLVARNHFQSIYDFDSVDVAGW